MEAAGKTQLERDSLGQYTDSSSASAADRRTGICCGIGFENAVNPLSRGWIVRPRGERPPQTVELPYAISAAPPENAKPRRKTDRSMRAAPDEMEIMLGAHGYIRMAPTVALEQESNWQFVMFRA